MRLPDREDLESPDIPRKCRRITFPATPSIVASATRYRIINDISAVQSTQHGNTADIVRAPIIRANLPFRVSINNRDVRRKQNHACPFRVSRVRRECRTSPTLAIGDNRSRAFAERAAASLLSSRDYSTASASRNAFFAEWRVELLARSYSPRYRLRYRLRLAE